MIDKLKEEFRKVDPRFGPVPFWWWSAEEITEERVQWQLRKFRAGGLRNIGIINIAPTGPQYGSISDNPKYFSEKWWEMFEVAVREAERLGMFIWFYDQIGFSGSNFPARIVTENPEFSGYVLKRFSIEQNIPEDAEIIYKDNKYFYATLRQGFDWLNPKACEILLNTIHGEFERRFSKDLGKTIAGTFQDELPPLPMWVEHMPQLYKEKYNEDLLPNIDCLFEENKLSEKIRRRVYEIASELAEEAFFIPISKWHEKYDMLLGCDQAGPARRVEVHGAQRLYLDYMKTHRWYSSPGADMDGEVKPHSSMVHLHGGKRVWLEGFHSSGWGGTLEETMHWLIPWFQGGVTLYSPHAVYYSTKGGWWEWASPDTGWRQPYFEHYEVFADTVSRICSLLSKGKHVADIGVHYPSYAATGLMSLDDGEDKEHPMSVANKTPNKKIEHLQKVYENLTGKYNRKEQNFLGVLREDQRDYDIIDDAALEKSFISDGKLCIAEERFSVLILSGTTVMKEKAKEKLKEWIKKGGVVIGVNILKEDPLLEGIEYVENEKKAIEIIESLLEKRVIGNATALHRKINGHDVFLLLPDKENLIPMHKPVDDQITIQKEAVYKVKTKGIPEEWNPVTGEVNPLPFKREGEYIEVKVNFDSWPASLIVCSMDTKNNLLKNHGKQSIELETELKNDKWKVNVVPTLDNTYGDFDLHSTQKAILPVERRIVWVRKENKNEDGKKSAWFLEQNTPNGWEEYLWSETTHWTASTKENFEEDTWNVRYSHSLGDMSFKTWAGRMGRVPRKFLNLGDAIEGQAVWARSYVISKESKNYWVRTESNASISIWVNGEKINLEGGTEEATSWIKLNEGTNEITLRAIANTDGVIRVGIEINEQEQAPLPKWIYPNKKSNNTCLFTTIDNPEDADIEEVKMIFAARGRVALTVNDIKVTEHGDFNPYIRQGQEEVDLTQLWRNGKNEIKFIFPEGEGEVFADGRIQYVNGEDQTFFTRDNWKDENLDNAIVFHESVLQFAETESLWLNNRPHPLSDVGWLMPNSIPKSIPLTFYKEVENLEKPIWIKFPLPAGAKSFYVKCSSEVEAWINEREISVTNGKAEFIPQKAGTMVTLRIKPNGKYSGADILEAPIQFETSSIEGELGDWRKVLHLPHHSGVVEYETKINLVRNEKYILDLGHVRGTAEVWIDDELVDVRIWRPYKFELEPSTSTTSHIIRIRVTNTLGTHYQIGRPSNVIGGEKLYWNKDIDQEGWTDNAASGGLYGPVRLYKVLN